MTGSIHPLLRLSSVGSIAPATPYLSFLYETRTIIRPWLLHQPRSAYHQTRRSAATETRTKQATRGASIRSTKQDAGIPAQDARKTRKAIDRNDKDIPSTNRSNTFLEILQEHTSKPKTKPSYTRSRTVTMTQKEHEVFERLQNISGKKKISQTELKLIDGLNDDAKDEELAAIFDNIVDKQEPTRNQNSTKLQQQSVDQSAKNEEKEHPKARIERVSSESTTDQPVTTSAAPASERFQVSSSTNHIKKSHANQRNQGEKLEGLLASAKSDYQLWQLLDKHVFQDMRDLAVVLKQNEGSGTLIATSARKPTWTKGEANQSPQKVQEFHTDEPSPRKVSLMKVTDTYGPALLHSARLFRAQFPHSPYTALLLPTIKKLGPISYVLAGSTALYNELLYIRWVYYRDLNGCADLIEDMVSHNILADERTSVVLQMASKTRAKEMSPDEPEGITKTGAEETDGVTRRQSISKETSPIASGTPAKSFMAGWWQLQGIEAGWARWINAHERLATITRKEMQRQEEEQMLASQASDPPPEETELENPNINHSFAEKQMAATDALEPEIELITLEDVDEPEIAAVA